MNGWLYDKYGHCFRGTINQQGKTYTVFYNGLYEYMKKVQYLQIKESINVFVIKDCGHSHTLFQVFFTLLSHSISICFIKTFSITCLCKLFLKNIIST